jgi:5-methylcytosine-specific restriction endonuclease McrA
MKRRPLTRLQRTRIYDSANGVCCICGNPVNAERGTKWIVEHIKPLWLGGADDESNMGPAHQSCAVEKTVSEAPVKAKGDRVRAKHLGIRKRRTIRGWRKFNGTPVHAQD